jgi:hypothetical protein
MVVGLTKHRSGHGVAMCHRVDGKWRILNMHNALLEPISGTKPQVSRRQAQ